MGLGNSIKHKLFFILVIMGAIPFIIVICLSSMNMIRDWEVSVKKNGDLRNKIISEHVTELFEKNFYVLHATAVNSSVIDYVKNPRPEKQKEILFLLQNTNKIFRDKNLMALTASNAEQLVRTDGSKLVNIGNRKHFHAAMEGKDYVSNVIVSMSTGEMIVVLTSPVKDENDNSVGILQRNFNIRALQDFVETQDDEETSVIILDGNGRVIVDSEKNENISAENFLNDDNYKFISELGLKNSETVHVNVNGYEALVSHSKNPLTNWTIISVQPYKYILNQVYGEILKDALIGLVMLLIVAAVSYYTSVRATRPILEITRAANIMASGNLKVESLHVNSEDEIGKMAEAFNKISSARDAYQLEAEIDTLTKLYNKKTFEIACKNKLKEFKNFGAEKKFMALYIIDLDHFKEVNDTRGHQFGDRVLEEFAAKLKKSFRPYDYVARFGGDEFLVLLTDLPNTEIISRKAEWINQFARELTVDGENAKISASIGIAVIPNEGFDYEEIFNSADKSLYFVKNNGRDGYFFNA